MHLHFSSQFDLSSLSGRNIVLNGSQDLPLSSAQVLITISGDSTQFFGGYHPTLKLSGFPTFTFIVSLARRMDNI